MLYTSRATTLVLAGLNCAATTALLSVIKGVSAESVMLVGTLSFVASFALIYATLEHLVFGELGKIYKLLERVNRKQAKGGGRASVFRPLANPIRQLNAEIQSLADRNQAEIDELKRLETYRREFLADISHELKTPLFAAQGFIHTLLDGAADDETVRSRFLRKAAISLDGLGEMVQELLLLSQLETGVLRMKLEVFDVGKLAQEVAEQLEEKVESRNQTLTLQGPDNSLWVEADRSRLRQVLVNLTENAIKYGNPGGAVHLSMEAAKSDTVRVRITDDGPGIPQEHLSRIFERFYRVEKSRSRDMGGIGLGLAIVKQILEAHDTRITVRSELGQGAEFTFTLKKQKPPLLP